MPATIYGRNTTVGNNVLQANQGSNNQYGNNLLISVATGVILALNVYMAGSSAFGTTARTRLCLWDNSGNLIVAGPQFTAPQGSGGLNGQFWFRTELFPPVVVSSVQNYYIGFWRNPADSAEFSYITTAARAIRPAVGSLTGNVASPGALAIGTGTTGWLSAYAEWTDGVLIGPAGGGAGKLVTDAKIGPTGGGAPKQVLGVYIGPPGGGTPIRLW